MKTPAAREHRPAGLRQERLPHRRSDGGFTLLEAMIALTIFGLVVLGYLELFAATGRMARDSDEWSRAVAVAEDAMEAAKLDALLFLAAEETELEGGFTREARYEPWGPGLARFTVVVGLPGGGRFELQRLMSAP